MKRSLLVFAVVLALGIGGCKIVEGAFGIQRDPETGEIVGTPDGGVVGSVVGSFLPWGGPLIGALVAAYADLKRRQGKKALVATLKGVEEAASNSPAIKATLAKHHTAAKVYSVVKTILDKEGIKSPKTI